ncbi:pentapeptide repeat-containing protein (plasmid) [Nocardia sp. CA-129566]|uniref:pentapeptide repeat-containing protein n=1 Tax=Nocardia sp. CA-129566 TaxID=3239976 RepID=UPI003D96D92D
MRRTFGGLATVFVVSAAGAGTAAAQPGATTTLVPEPTTLAVQAIAAGGLTQPYATVITGALAVVVALIALTGVLLTRSQAERHFSRTHALEQTKGLRERYTTCAEQLAHTSPAVRQAGVYGLAALADDWNNRTLHEEARVCLDLLCAYLRASTGPEDQEVRHSIAAVIRRHADQWSRYRYDLHGADLTSADLTGAKLIGANLTDAKLRHTNLHEAKLPSADLTRADLTDADLTSAHLFGTDLTGANLTAAYVASADLTHADLTGADLTSANLASADLASADLTGANLASAHLFSANLTDADLTDVAYDESTRWPDGFAAPAARV